MLSAFGDDSVLLMDESGRWARPSQGTSRPTREGGGGNDCCRLAIHSRLLPWGAAQDGDLYRAITDPYLRDVLLRIATHPQRLVDQLTPRSWERTFGPQATA